ncbi:GGDEF domain-containing response regulator [Pseudanabaena yagii]|uniref:Diguanylate cyclase n=1 Tax=Pseudanabaena yagii GIHE-NHR1 TaxID=2722753 RepID=A0ABX1LPN5_9CYAN|nr:diguanylate cyclase [Pseudanabaena yagii]NMF57283.1 diguanylate cyclase [Pseudanabaena yagii GIHE-NHR1]
MTNEKILIVEDELLIARDLSQKLKGIGYQIVAIVSSGQAALDVIDKNPPDLVLMDIVIKGDRDGIDTTQVINEKFGIPVIYITAYADDATLDRAEKSGAYGYILKPFNDRELHASIKLALHKAQKYKALEYQSTRDALTTLYNRHYFQEALYQERLKAERQSSCLSLLMLDIDFFKRFNDTFGHDAGDYVLREVGALLKRLVRASDIVCRYGGEEMLILIPNCDEIQAEVIANHVRAECQALDPIYQDRHLGQITVSIGVATFPKHARTETALLKSADDALYRAKMEGRNRVLVALELID